MTTSVFRSIKDQLLNLTERQRVEISALLHRQKQGSAAWQKEMARRMAEMDAGKKVSLSKLIPR